MEQNIEQQDLTLINEKLKLENEQEKLKQKTIQDSLKLAKINLRKEISVKKLVIKSALGMVLSLFGIVCVTFMLSIFIPSKVEGAIDIIKNII